MPNQSKLQFPNKKQFIITLPKCLVLAKGWKKGCVLRFIINKEGDIVIKKTKGKI